MLRLHHVASPDSPTLKVTTAANEHSCIVDSERYEYTGPVRDKDFQQRALQAHIVAPTLAELREPTTPVARKSPSRGEPRAVDALW